MVSPEYYAWRQVTGLRLPMDVSHMLVGFTGIEGNKTIPTRSLRGLRADNKARCYMENQRAADWLETLLLKEWFPVRVDTPKRNGSQAVCELSARFQVEPLGVLFEDFSGANYNASARAQQGVCEEFNGTTWMWVENQALARTLHAVWREIRNVEVLGIAIEQQVNAGADATELRGFQDHHRAELKRFMCLLDDQ